MNGPGDIPLTYSNTPDTKTCSLISIIPTLGMSSCRGRAEAFARSLSSKLRTLGPQTNDDVISQEDEPIINGDNTTNTWRTSNDSEQPVTDLQPLRHESDSFFDFDCELESPGSPVDECEYLRLIETASNTPHNSAAESGYVCASTASSQGSSEAHYDGVMNDEDTVDSQQATRVSLHPAEFPAYMKALKPNGTAQRLHNGYEEHIDSEHDDEVASAFEQKQLESSPAEEAGTPGVVEEVPPPESPPLDEVALHEHPEKCEHRMHYHAQHNVGSDSESPSTLLVAMQHDIIAELQDHSDRVTESIDIAAADEVAADDKPVASPEITKEPEAEAPKLKLDVSNVHTAKAEETLHTEMTEVTCGKVEKEVQTKDLDEPLTPVDDSPPAEGEDATKSNNTNSTKGQKPLSGLETDDEDECRPQRVRRCSSLKTGKTPPGTPGRKKIVRFADVLGLDLADVKTFLDEIPNIPKSAYEDLEILETEPPIQLGPKSDKFLMPLFQQPGGLPNFLDRVREKQVSLENAAVTDTINQTITGTVRVRNLDFHKSVHIRYSLDNWRSFADLQANYVENSCDGFSDKFSFVLFGNTLQVGQRLELAVRFQCKGQQFWDNNYGANYCFQCLPATTPATSAMPPVAPSHHVSHISGMISPTVSDAWCTSFY